MATTRERGSPIPLLDALASYRNGWLRADVVAGLITAAIVIPKAMAYATIAGLPVQAGLYTCLVPMIVYALLGTSRPLSVSTTTTLAILTAAQLAAVAPGGDPAALARIVATLTLIVGAILIASAVLRLGFVANFISAPVLIGFKAGIGCVIVLDQLPKLLGIHFHKGGFLHNVGALVRGIPETSLPTLAVALAVIALLVAMERYLPALPAPLVVVAVAIAAMRLLGLEAHGIESVGEMPRGMPGFVPPDLSLVATLWPGAAGIALMSFTESIAAGRAFEAADEPRLRPNQELLATGVANAAGAVFGSMPAGGGTSQTAVNRHAGARSQVAGLVTAAGALLTMLVLAPLIGSMPQATLAAVVIVYSIGLIQPADFRAVLRVRRTEFVWALTAFAGVMLLGTLKGILVAIVVSLAALAHQSIDPPVRRLGRKPGTNVFRPLSPEHPGDETFDGLLMLQLEGRVFFANAARVGEKLRPLIAEHRPRVVALEMSGVPDLEYTALAMLIDAEARLRRQGSSVWLVGMTPAVLRMVRRSPLGAALGDGRMHFNLESAVARFQSEMERPA